MRPAAVMHVTDDAHAGEGEKPSCQVLLGAPTDLASARAARRERPAAVPGDGTGTREAVRA
ncbi:hypothetical protein GCM10010392_56370 [Streptomyces clavifer]|nr:hypothetical protein GCM10010392_56370 [Streptomyces clavifer]